jgi:hypothetical protein
MDLVVVNRLKSNPMLREYVRNNSYWYKYLNRNGHYIKEIEEEMKIKYKMTVNDRIDKFSNNIEMIQTLLQILQ